MRPNSKWYTEELRAEKRKKRQLKRKYRSTKLEVDKEIVITHCKTIHIMIPVAKRNYYSNLIQESSGDQKKLFQISGKFMHTKTENKLPSHASVKELTKRFANIFEHKITNIRFDLEKISSQQQTLSFIHQSVTESSFSQFELLTEDQIVRLIKTLAFKWCDLDLFLTPLWKECLTVLLPVITKIVHFSLSTKNHVRKHEGSTTIAPVKKS